MLKSTVSVFVLSLLGVLVVANCLWAIDLSVSIVAKEAATMKEVSYKIGDSVVTVSGSAITTAVSLDVTGLEPGVVTLYTSVGRANFLLAPDGTISELPNQFLEVDGSTLTLVNEMGSDVTIKGRMNTSARRVGFLVYSGPSGSHYYLDADTSIGDVVYIDGDELTEGVSYSVRGLLPMHWMRVKTVFGQAWFRYDYDGSLISYNHQGTNPTSCEGNTLYLENVFSYDLVVRGSSNTSIANVGFQLSTAFNVTDDNVVDQLYQCPGSELTDGVTFDFRGFCANTRFGLLTTFGLRYLRLDEAGYFVPDRHPMDDPARFPYEFDNGVFTIQNDIHHTLQVKLEKPTNMEEVAFKCEALHAYLATFPELGPTTLGETVIVPGGGVGGAGGAVDGVSYEAFGMTRSTILWVYTSLGKVGVSFRPEGEPYIWSDGTNANYVPAFCSGSDVVVQNSIDCQVKFWWDDEPLFDSREISLRRYERFAMPGSFAVGEPVVVSKETATSPHYLPLQGVCPNQVIQIDGVGWTFIQFEADGTIKVLGHAAQDGPTGGSLTNGSTGEVFRFEVEPFNRAPVVSVQDDVTLLSSEQASVVLTATAFDSDGDELTYQWFLDDVAIGEPAVLQPGEAVLALGGLEPLAVGEHEFRFEVSDGGLAASGVVVVCVENSEPVVSLYGGGTVSLEEDVVLGGMIADADGDNVSFVWSAGAEILATGILETAAGGAPVAVPALVVPAVSLGMGPHTIALTVNDGVTGAVIEVVDVVVVDVTAPTLNPIVEPTILWPPNGKMRRVTVFTNGSDNSGGELDYAIEVTSNDQISTEDYEVVSIDGASGVIELKLRAKRSRHVRCRVYTLLVSAVDASGNVAEASATVKVPRNRGCRPCGWLKRLRRKLRGKLGKLLTKCKKRSKRK